MKSKIEESENRLIYQRKLIWLSVAGLFLLLLLVFTFWWQRNAKKRTEPGVGIPTKYKKTVDIAIEAIMHREERTTVVFRVP